jgi:subtilisin-like proprotein convertase family protein
MRYILVVLLLPALQFLAHGQCDCQDCPLSIPPLGGNASTINISGATNPTLGQNGQDLRSVTISLEHDDIADLDITIVSPNGGTIDLSTPSSSAGINVLYNICFLACGETADPDPGFPATFDSGAGYLPNETYNGSYYPADNSLCFEDISGPVNGEWRLEIADSDVGDGGTLLDWKLEFYDNDGTGCEEGCDINVCEADGGDINGDVDTLFEGDPALDRSLPPTYPGAEPDPADYGYTYVISDEDTDIILAYDEEADLTSFDPGTYVICGLSYLIDDFDDIPDPNGSYTLTDLQDDIDEPLFCADLSENCETITILPEASTSCSCTNCELDLPTSGSAVSEIEITGATNPTIGSNGQGLRAVRIFMIHDAVPELTMTLIAPNGAEVDLMEQTSSGVGENITFDICFLNCSETADPDPGFPAVFDSNAGYEEDETYSGSYFPAGGCFSDYDGSAVNGTWRLEIFDGVGLDGGTLFDWELEFYDNDGTNCEQACDINPCQADGGDLDGQPDTLCLGDPDLNRDLPPTYSGSEPDPAEYGYTYVITNTFTDVILAYDEDADLTGFDVGTYTICGLSYLLDDFDDIPDPDGTYTQADLQEDIDEPLFCADLSENCETITIVPEPEMPEITGPLEVCADEPVEYIIENYDPAFEYTVSIIQGGFSAFAVDEEVVSITLTSGPAELCFVAENACGLSDEACITIEVVEAPVPIEVTGPTPVCEGQEYTYTIDPPLGPGESYDFDVNGGTITGQAGNTVTVEWSSSGSNTLIVNIEGSPCPIPSGSISVTIDTYDFPPTFNSPATGCVGDTFISFIDPDPDILVYDWSGSGIDILSGGNSNAVTYVISESGIIEVCLEVETDCGLFGPECEDIDVNEVPEPEIVDPGPGCDLEFDLEASVGGSSDVNWFGLSGPGTINFSPVDQPNTVVTVSENGIYSLAIEEDNNGCVGLDTIEVEIFESPEIIDTSFSCDINREFTFSFFIEGGVPPYEVNGTPIPGNAFTSDPIPSGSNFSFTVVDENGCEDEVSGVFDCPCIIDAGTMSGELLEACLDDGESVTAIFSNDAVLGPNDIGRFYLHDNPGDNLGTILDDNETGIFEFVPGMVPGQTYYISYVVGEDIGGVPDLNDPCLSVAVGQPVIFYENPTANYLGDDAFCELATVLPIDISTFVDNFSWSLVNGPGGASFDDPSSQNPFVTVSESGNYTFRVDFQNPACENFLEFAVEFRQPPLLNIVSTECISLDSFILEIDIQGVGSDFTVDLPGTLNGGTFTSDPLDNSLTYTLTVTDDIGCTAELSGGPIVCDCLSEAGDMSSDQIDLCITADSLFFDFLGGDNLDGDDTTGFVIHSGTGNFLVDPVFFSSSSSIALPDTLEPGRLYYISRVVGSTLASGEVDLSDPCLAASVGQPLFLYDLPNFSFEDSVALCGLEAKIVVTNPGVGRIDVVSNSTDADITFSVNRDTLIWQVDTATRIIYTYVEDNGFCERIDTGSIDFFGSPEFVDVQTTCSGEDFTYEFSITGGQAPYLLNGNPIASLPIIGDTLSADSILRFVVEDQRACFSDTLILDVDCSCLSRTGEPTVDFIELCSGDSLRPSDVIFSGTQLELGDTLLYILYDGPDPSNDNELARQFVPTFSDPGIPRGDTAYLRAWVGPFSGDSILFADPCAAISDPIWVVWQAINTLSADVSNARGCVGDSIQVIVTAEGVLPINVQLEVDGSFVDDFSLTQRTDTLHLPVFPATLEWSLFTSSARCPSADTVTITIEGISPLSVDFSEPDTLCNSALLGSELDLSTLLEDPSIEGNWSSNDFNVSGNRIDADGLPAGNYEVIFSTIGFEAPCPGQEFALSIPVDSCSCPQVSLPDQLDFCEADLDFDLSAILSPNAYPGDWSVENLNGEPQPPAVRNDSLIISEASSGDYELRYDYEDPLPEGCPEAVAIGLSIEESLAIGEVLAADPICRSGSPEVNLFDYLDGASRRGQWNHASGPIDSLVSPTDYALGVQIFTYSLPVQGACPEQEVDIELEFSEAPVVEVTAFDERCAGDEDGSIDATIIDNDTGPYESFLNDNIANLPLENLAPGNYIFSLENAAGCSSDTLVTIEPGSSIEVDLGADLTGAAGDRFDLRAQVRPDSVPLSTIQWFVNGEVAPISSLQWSEEFLEASTVSIKIASQLGCPASDELRIRLASPEIYIPNVFHPSGGIDENRRFGPISAANDIQVDQFFIFDRWGNQLFGVQNVPINTAPSYWNGRADGQLLNPGVYVYNLRVRYPSGDTETFVGSVTLVD